MALNMILGASGTGKSEYIFDKITKEADANRDKHFFVIVPDQFTMQTQVDMVEKSGSKHGIMNIDVLSFSRLAHRIYEETGAEGKLVLDDTGKSLILRKLAGEIKDEIPFIGANLRRDGFISEVKSVISELMQYGVTPEGVDTLIELSSGQGALTAKLKDIKVIYKRFLEYIKDSYITSEESMDVLAGELDKSALIPGSVICFDGFTGFTPVQMKVLVKLMTLCEDVYITLTLEKGKENCREEDLFWFTAKSYNSILKEAAENGISIGETHYCMDNYRFSNKPDLAYLERNIFRAAREAKGIECERISLYEAVDITDEVRWLAKSIRGLIEDGAQYRDIAVITGNMTDYENHIERVFSQFRIPAYIDKTHALVMNPFVEYSKSLLQIVINDFDSESVTRFLRSGIGGFDTEDVDLFENFILMTGVRGKKKYCSQWEYRGRSKARSVFNDEEVMQRINALRERITAMMGAFLSLEMGRNAKRSAKAFSEALYQCYLDADMYGQLDEFRKEFETQQDYTKEREYAQVYRLSVMLLEQVHGLLGDEELTIEEFARIIEAGFDEITVGTIPQSVDRVIVGDIERSRLKPVKYLFFLGINDNAIPKRGGSCNLLSDMEREMLSSNGATLAPTPREKMYIQRFYLYNNLVKPSDKLYLSYSLLSGDGSSIRPAYIVHMICKLFGDLKKETGHRQMNITDIYNSHDLKEYICDLLRKHGESSLNTEELNNLVQAIYVFRETEKDAGKELLEMMINNSFFRYADEGLEAKIAGIMYGEVMLASISRMERFAECAYAYFLQYGLSLQERQLYSLDNREMGTIFHEVLEEYGKQLRQMGLTWFEVDEETSAQIIERQLSIMIEENASVLLDSEAGQYIRKKMARALNRAVNTLAYQLKAGEFGINNLEMTFKRYEAIDEVNVALDVQERMQLEGRIDRIDTCEGDDGLYVKVVDYKSGNKDFSLTYLYYGLQLQLVVYLDESMKHVSKQNKDKDIIPAAILYYRIADEKVNIKDETSPEKISEMIHKELCTKGIVNEDMDIIKALDRDISGKSSVIPVSLKAGGGFNSTNSVMSSEQFELMMEYAKFKLRNIGNDIITGKITKNPVSDGDRFDSCTYCAYKEVCGFDIRLEGYNKTAIVEESKEVLFEKMKQDIEEE